MPRPIAIRDVVGRIIGYHEIRGTKTYLLNVVKRELGYYDEATNQTWQIYPVKKMLSREGNILGTLIGSDNNG